MTFRIYTIYDKVAEQSGPVFQAVNDGVAVRQFRGVMQAQPGLNPAEYSLWCIGEYNDEFRSDQPNRLVAYNTSIEVDVDFDYVEAKHE